MPKRLKKTIDIGMDSDDVGKLNSCLAGGDTEVLCEGPQIHRLRNRPITGFLDGPAAIKSTHFPQAEQRGFLATRILVIPGKAISWINRYPAIGSPMPVKFKITAEAM